MSEFKNKVGLIIVLIKAFCKDSCEIYQRNLLL